MALTLFYGAKWIVVSCGGRLKSTERLSREPRARHVANAAAHLFISINPEVAGHTATDRAKSDCAYDDLIRSLDKVLKDANFEELPHERVTEAHRKRTVPVEVRTEHDDFREVRFYKRGRHVEQLELSEWFGLRRREVEIEVFDDIVLERLPAAFPS